ncbi:hypothetical protein BGZ49_007442 [Haplosporangium sp. Z 27]|nr:hypothetical protein BGZ49_007442 [Haplosporangium sp. Z 27]
MNMTAGFYSGYGTSIWSPSMTPTSEPQFIGALVGLFLLSIGFRGLVAAQGYLEAYLHLHFYPRPPSHSSSSSSSHSRTHIPHTHQQPQYQQLEPKNGDDEEEQQLEKDNLGEKYSNGHLTEINNLTLQDEIKKQKSDDQPYTQSTAKFRRYRQHQNVSSYDHFTALSHHYTLPTVQPFVWQAEALRAVLTTGVVAVGYLLMLVIMTYNSAYLGAILLGVFVGEVYFGRWGRARPIFSSPSSSRSRSPYKEDHTNTIPNAVNGDIRSNANPQSPGAISTHSLSSKASSYGFSSTVAHHSPSAEGC